LEAQQQQPISFKPTEIPPLHIQMLEWRYRIHKGPKILKFEIPATFRIIGLRYVGKSSLGEAIATHILFQGGTILDWFSAKSSEGLAWLDSPYAHEVALMVGSNCTLKTMDGKELPIPWKRWNDWGVSDIPKHKIWVMVRAFFEDESEYYLALLRLVDKLSQRDEYREGKPDVILIREAQQFLKAATSASNVHNQRQAEQTFIDMHDEAVHSGFSVIVDSKRVNTINKDIRDTSDYTFYKNMGAEDLPDSMHHLFNEYPSDMFRSLPPWEFIMHTRWNAVGKGISEYPFWHIKRGRSLLKMHDIDIAFDKENRPAQAIALNIGRPTGPRKVTKEVHDLMVSYNAEGKNGPQTILKIKEVFGIDVTRATVSTELQKHRANICGYCEKGAITQ
jgi:hypothetical protein